jgi:Tol biopolymer transport system component
VIYDHWYGSASLGTPLSIVDLATGVSWDLTEGWDPEWSPDGGAIAFRCTHDDDPYLKAIYAINVDGSDRRMVFADTEKPKTGLQAEWHYRPCWSPTGSHLTCYRQTFDTMRGSYFGDVLRAEADGDRLTNLTKDIGGYAGPIGWR